MRLHLYTESGEKPAARRILRVPILILMTTFVGGYDLDWLQVQIDRILCPRAH